jgi:hypothetical protein
MRRASKRTSMVPAAALTAILAACALAAAPVPAMGAEEPAVPAVVLDGLEAYKTGGAPEAIASWVKGGPLAGNKDLPAQTEFYKQVEAAYGSYRGWEYLRTVAVSPSVKTVYLIMKFERGPVFGSFLVYRPGEAWILVDFNLNTRPENVLPPAVSQIPP